MDKIFEIIKSFFNNMNDLLLAVLSVGILVQVLFGGSVFGMDVVGNVTNLINSLGNSGFVGLIAVILLMKILKKVKIFLKILIKKMTYIIGIK